MANDTNGGGRLDRIEKLLESAAEKLDKIATTVYLHEDRLIRIETGAEEIQQSIKDMVAENKRREKALDERIDKLVSAMGEFVRKAS